jgi:SAM-dependent methyltransferase
MHLRSWGRFYRSEASRRVPTTPSPFAVWVADRIEPGQHVLDVGCGNGRDAVHLAERGHVVEALDGTSAAQRLTDQLARKHAVDVHPRPLNLNDLFSTLSTGARFAHAERPPHIYARFLLEAIETDARRNFYRWAQMIQRRGGRTFLEFRVRDQARDPQEPRRTPTHYRAHLDAARVVAQIERYGGTVEHREEGVDLAPSRRENPRTCRLVVRWT